MTVSILTWQNLSLFSFHKLSQIHHIKMAVLLLLKNIFGYTLMSRNKQSRKYFIGRSFKNDEFDWPFDLLIVTLFLGTYFRLLFHSISCTKTLTWG